MLGLFFLVLMEEELEGTRETGGDLQLEGSDVEGGLLSRCFELTVIEAMRCSLAILDAFVSRANRGVES